MEKVEKKELVEGLPKGIKVIDGINYSSRTKVTKLFTENYWLLLILLCIGIIPGIIYYLKNRVNAVVCYPCGRKKRASLTFCPHCGSKWDRQF